MVTIRTGDFAVEVAKKGRIQSRRPLTKVFRNRANAVKFSKIRLRKGDGIVITKVSRNSTQDIVLRGLKGKGKSLQNFGKL